MEESADVAQGGLFTGLLDDEPSATLFEAEVCYLRRCLGVLILIWIHSQA